MIDDRSNAKEPDRYNGRTNESGLEYQQALRTSGMTFSLEEITEKDHFTTDLFLDWADHEWCYRLSQKGWKFATSKNTFMLHRLGERMESFLGKKFFVPTPFRHYFQVRDGLLLALKSYVPIKARIRIISTIPIRMMLYPVILENGLERFKWMLNGILSACLKEKGSARCAHIVDKTIS